MNRIAQLALDSPCRRLVLPIAVHPGAALTGATIREVVTDPAAQTAAASALLDRFHSPITLSAMDLSAEAEAFGCQVMMGDHEVPTITGRLVTSLTQAQALRVPKPGDARTRVYLETVQRLKALPTRPLVLAGCIGPFSLAARLAGVSETCELTLTEPGFVHLLIEKSATFLADYVLAFKAVGADGLIMAEPAAGLLSPRSMAVFSSAYVRRILQAINDPAFGFILHNCAAKLPHLKPMLQSGAGVLHFGSPMDLPGALGEAPADVVLCGNLDPTAVFVQGSASDVANQARRLLHETRLHRNFILSSGCDVPAAAPLANLDALYSAAAESDQSGSAIR